MATIEDVLVEKVQRLQTETAARERALAAHEKALDAVVTAKERVGSGLDDFSILIELAIWLQEDMESTARFAAWREARGLPSV